MLLSIQNLSKSFEVTEGQVTAVANFSFDVQAGEVVSIIGPSGCGKSTIFNIVGGLLGDYEGEIVLEGKSISGPHPAVGMVFQEDSTLPWRTTLDNVAFPLEVAGIAKQERHERARQFVAMVGLKGYERHYPATLSGGMRQRVSLARTLIAEPRLLLMDEPFAALDEQTRLLLGDKILQIQQSLRQTVLLITHNITEAVQLSDRVIVMTYRPGRIKKIVPIELARPRTSEIVGSPEFGRCVAEIWSDLREESLRGLDASERATQFA